MDYGNVGDRPDEQIVALVEEFQLRHNVGFADGLARVMASARGRALLAEYNKMHSYKPAANAQTDRPVRPHQIPNAESELQDRARALLQTNGRISYDEAVGETLRADPELAVRVARSMAEKCQSGSRPS